MRGHDGKINSSIDHFDLVLIKLFKVVYVCSPGRLNLLMYHEHLMTSYGGCENISRVFNDSRSDLYFHNSEMHPIILDPGCHRRICRSQFNYQGVI